MKHSDLDSISEVQTDLPKSANDDAGTDCVGEYRPVVESFKHLYQNLNAATVSSGLIESTYDEEMRFEDNFHHIDGRVAFRQYCEALYENVSDIEFEFHDDFIKPGAAMLTWTMRYKHPKLNKGRVIVVEGSSLIKFRDKIIFHKDYFDGGQLLYEQVPLLGSVIQHLKKRMAS